MGASQPFLLNGARTWLCIVQCTSLQLSSRRRGELVVITLSIQRPRLCAPSRIRSSYAGRIVLAGECNMLFGIFRGLFCRMIQYFFGARAADALRLEGQHLACALLATLYRITRSRISSEIAGPACLLTSLQAESPCTDDREVQLVSAK